MSRRGRLVEASDNRSFGGVELEEPLAESNLRAFAATALVIGLLGALAIGLAGILGVAILVQPQQPVAPISSVGSLSLPITVVDTGLSSGELGLASAFRSTTAAPAAQSSGLGEVSSDASCRRLQIELLGEDGVRGRLILDGESFGEASQLPKPQAALSKLQTRLQESGTSRDIEVLVPRGLDALVLSRVLDTLLASKVSYEVLGNFENSKR